MEKMDSTSMNLEKDNIEKLKELFPNCVTEGKIDFDMLRGMLGDEVDNNREKYQFTWNGKAQAIKIAQTPSTATLRPCKEKSKNWDTTRNLYIEGDNLESLKQLQKTYFGKIDVIYIDPPYNTGSDFVYKDDFKNTIENYKEQTNQTTKSNPETSGRFHTDWLNMIYPRLILARNLLSEKGVIFISIDDNEQDNLKKICDEVFGESNFISQIVWERAFAPINLKKHFSVSHDYILCFAKNINSAVCNGLPRTEESNSRYANPDNDPRGPWQSDNSTVGPAVAEKIYPIITPGGKTVFPPNGRCWLYTKERFDEMIKDNRIWFGEDGNNVPRVKRFLSEVKQGLTPMSIWKYQEVGHSQEASQKLKKLFAGKSYFEYPKPVELIKRCIQLYGHKESIVLDFFSGSATTSHAVMQLNSEDNGKRRFIMIQLPEPTENSSQSKKDGFDNICDIGEERIRIAGETLKQQWINSHKGEGLFADENIEFPVDIGFKVFRLDSSNIKAWNNVDVLSEDALGLYNKTFEDGRSKEDILYEIMLKYGFFDMKASEVSINGKQMYKVGSRFMLVCLEDNITSDDIKTICEEKPKYVVFKEEGFANDNDKINAEYNLKKAGVEEVKCI